MSLGTTKVNLACGASYIDGDGWINFDYSPVCSVVMRADLLTKLPLNDNEANIVYSSHFFEHVPQENVMPFLNECHRILKPMGTIRLVLPDFQEMCKEYLKMRESNQNLKADFLMLEILDQCVRQRPGGRLADYYLELVAEENKEMAEYVSMRTGETFEGYKKIKNKFSQKKVGEFIKNKALIKSKLTNLYCKFITRLLPNAFLKQNVSFAHVGERHTWVYDFHTVAKLLKEAGFDQIEKKTFNSSKIASFPFTELDLLDEATPRKGVESMYVEAVKA